jgi:uncharacterized protein (DUF736 family)
MAFPTSPQRRVSCLRLVNSRARDRLHRQSRNAHCSSGHHHRPAEPSDAENAPDYRVHAFDDEQRNRPEIGAGWKRTGEKAGEYVALLIDDPAFPQPIRANLFRDDDAGNAWSLHWSRPRDRAEKD